MGVEQDLAHVVLYVTTDKVYAVIQHFPLLPLALALVVAALLALIVGRRLGAHLEHTVAAIGVRALVSVLFASIGGAGTLSLVALALLGGISLTFAGDAARAAPHTGVSEEVALFLGILESASHSLAFYAASVATEGKDLAALDSTMVTAVAGAIALLHLITPRLSAQTDFVSEFCRYFVISAVVQVVHSAASSQTTLAALYLIVLAGVDIVSRHDAIDGDWIGGVTSDASVLLAQRLLPVPGEAVTAAELLAPLIWLATEFVEARSPFQNNLVHTVQSISVLITTLAALRLIADAHTPLAGAVGFAIVAGLASRVSRRG